MAAFATDISLHLLPTLLTIPSFLCVTLLTAFLGYFLSPGGLAWAFSKGRTSNLPGPSGIPFVGLLFAFTSGSTHRVLAKLATTFHAESLMAFSVGFTKFVIASKPDTAKEMLGSSAFADRPIKESAYELLFHRAMGFAPYGEYWRNLRRISATHLFSPKRISAFGSFRCEIGNGMMDKIKTQMVQNGAVSIKKVLHYGALNNVMMSVFGRGYEEGDEVEKMVREGYELLGIFNWSDHFPLLGMMDFQGVRRRCRELVGRVNVFVESIIKEHRMKRSENVKVGDDNGDFVDVLLDLEGENKMSDSDMVAVLWEMIFRGTDTVAILLEWILARMVLHPDIQAKVQAEIDYVAGKARLVNNADLPNLPYLQAVVKETLRIHPPGPLLSWARLAIHDTHIGSHLIPAGTTAMVNMWAITHDEKVWDVPEKFKPERFLMEDVSVMGSDLRLAPFGSGRRVCPGKALGLATVNLWFAQLVQNFDWVASEGVPVDLSEVLKLSMEMKSPLVCKAVARI